MTADIALALSIFNLLIWVAVVITVRKLFKKMLPFLGAFGIQSSNSSTTYLHNSPSFDIIGGADELADAKSDE